VILSTTHVIDLPIKEYLGIVSSEVIVGANVLKDMISTIRDFVGGRVSSLENTLRDAREEALDSIAADATKLGANAVFGINIDFETFGRNGTMLMVCVSGTAVVTR